MCYADLLSIHTKLIDELQKIRNFRNRLAHSMLDTSKEFLTNGHTDRIQLIFYKDGQTKKQIITVKESIDRLKGSEQVLFELLDVQSEIKKRNSLT